MHIWGAYVHMHTKYEVSMSNPVVRGVGTDDVNDDNGQSMIPQGCLVDKPNEPKKTYKILHQRQNGQI